MHPAASTGPGPYNTLWGPHDFRPFFPPDTQQGTNIRHLPPCWPTRLPTRLSSSAGNFVWNWHVVPSL